MSTPADPHYVKLRSLVRQVLDQEWTDPGMDSPTSEDFERVTKNILDAIWPEAKAIIASGNLLAMDHTRTEASIDAWYILTDQERPNE